MTRCRIGYLLALLGAGGFFLFFQGYLSFYVFMLALVFPFFSLAVSLPGMLGTKTAFFASAKAIRRGERVTLTLAFQNRLRLPVGRLSTRIHCVNRLTGDHITLRRKGTGGSSGLKLSAELLEAHCGVIDCKVTQLKVCDLLGLFALHPPLPEPLEFLSLPLNLPPEGAPLLLSEGEQSAALRPKPGGGPGEDYDLRPYRVGDPLRTVHWKLSSKLDGLVVREILEPVQIQVLLTYDHFGSPSELDQVFDRLDALSRGLIEGERLHSIQWADPISGVRRSKRISHQKDLRDFEFTAFSMPAPATAAFSHAQASFNEGGPSPLRHCLYVGPNSVGVPGGDTSSDPSAADRKKTFRTTAESGTGGDGT